MSIIDPITSVELYIQRRRMKTQFDVTHTKKPRQISQYVFYFSLTRQKHKGLISINSNYKTLKLQIKFSKRNSPIVSSISQHSYLQWLFQFEANEPFLGLVMPTQLQNYYVGFQLNKPINFRPNNMHRFKQRDSTVYFKILLANLGTISLEKMIQCEQQQIAILN